jgi:chromosome partitioning protein
MSIAAPPKFKVTTKQIVDTWTSLPDDFLEKDLSQHIVSQIFTHLGYQFDRVKNQPTIGTGLIPDFLVYNDINQPPVLVVEIKKRVSALATVSESNFVNACEQHPLYQEATGLSTKPNNNGIIQYLDITKVRPECLASYGLVFNGDFFQLWRRVDGLIVPLTTIKRVTKSSLPKLLKELSKCLQAPPTAMVTSIWNRKGGVSKTTNTINIAACLAIAGKKVLLIDLDPQQDLTTGIGLKPYPQKDYLDRVYDKLQLQEIDTAKEIFISAIQTKTYSTTEAGINFELSLLAPNKDNLMEFAEEKLQYDFRIVFNDMLNLVRHDYDYILIDAAPKMDKIAECLLLATDTILLPTDVGGRSLKHAIDLSLRLLPKIQSMRDRSDSFGVGPWNLGLAYSNCDKNIGLNISKAIEQEITNQGFTAKINQTRLTTYAQTKMAEFKGIPVVCWQGSQISKLYQQLTNEVFLGHNYTNN